MSDPHQERQSAIDAHGIIGDLRSAALINDKGSVDFFCWPEFDSPSIFCSLLDTPDAGIFQLAPDLPDARREQIYLPDTNVLQTRWLSEHAVVEITDLLPIGDDEPLFRHLGYIVTDTGWRHCANRHCEQQTVIALAGGEQRRIGIAGKRLERGKGDGRAAPGHLLLVMVGQQLMHARQGQWHDARWKRAKDHRQHRQGNKRAGKG